MEIAFFCTLLFLHSNKSNIFVCKKKRNDEKTTPRSCGTDGIGDNGC